MTDDAIHHCGFIAVLGAPNAGKSTLVNCMVGTKVSIVSPKVQTTRARVRGIVMVEDTQLVLIDTPGIFTTAKRRLERAMIAAAWSGLDDSDAVLLVIDAQRGIDANSQAIIDNLRKSGRSNVLLVLNKIDTVDRPRLLLLAEQLFKEGIFSDVFMISALSGDGVGDLTKALVAKAPAGPWMFPEDELSDLPQRMLAAEITREKVFLQLHEELPYSITVETDSWEEDADGAARIHQTLFVLRDAHKPIVLGKAGARIKAIGAASRLELEHLLEQRIHLFLHVKVRGNWADDRRHYSDWGLDFDA